MKQNINIEAEGNELILKNKAGDYVVIPKKYRLEVQDMIKENCHGCIDKLVETLPVMEDYAPDGSVVPNDNKINFEYKPYTAVQDNTHIPPKVVIPLEQKKKQQFHTPDGSVIPNDKKNNFKYKPHTTIQDNTYVAPKVTMPLEINNKQQFVSKDQAVLKADTRTDQERKIAQEYTESVLNPSITTQIGEALQKPLQWTANPIKGIGDIVSALAPNSALAKDLPNTNAETFEYRKKRLNPYISNKEKIFNSIDKARDLTINSLINVGTMELGFALPKSFVSPAMTNMFKIGSKANFAADLLQLSKTDFDKLGDGDMNEIANVLLNSASLLSKMDNFDASTIYSNIKNWKNISKADKIDTYKDIFNISQSINQQTQRNEK